MPFRQSLPPSQLELIDEYGLCECPEDRLTFLLERPTSEGLLDVALCDESRRVPGCLSGLWLHGEFDGDECRFTCRSDSQVVQGVVSLLCDLSSGHAPEKIPAITASLTATLKLELLLTTTRKMAVAKSVAFINGFATRYMREAA